MDRPTNVFAMDDIKFMTGYNVEPVVRRSRGHRAIQKYYPMRGSPQPPPRQPDPSRSDAGDRGSKN